MPGFDDIQQLLDKAVGGGQIGAHQAFWRGITRDEFIAKRVYGYALVVVGDASASTIIKALRGEPPFGDDIGTAHATMPRMPAYMAAMPGEDIALIEQWISNGCTE